MNSQRAAIRLLASCLLLVLAAVAAAGAFGGPVSRTEAVVSAPAAISIDADFAGNTTTANLTTNPATPHTEALGPRNTCAKGNPDGIQNFDEDGVDVIGIDVTLQGYNPPPLATIPAATLTNAISDVQTSIVYTSTGDPFKSGDGVLIENERVWVTAVNAATNTATVQRGIADTDSVAHNADATVNKSEGMVAYGLAIIYPDNRFTISSSLSLMMIVALEGSTGFDTQIDTDEGDNRIEIAALDTGAFAAAETGSGVLARVPVTLDMGAAPGLYDFQLDEADVINTGAESNPASVLHDAQIAIGVNCPADDDADGLGNPFDNCPGIQNNDQANFDGDSMGDACDPDDDGDGFSDVDELAIGTTVLDPCGEPTVSSPIYSQSWAADLFAEGPFSSDRVDLQDIASFLAPAPAPFNTSDGQPGFHARWDISPGSGPSGDLINLIDMGVLLTLAPDMFGGSRAFGYPTACSP